MRDLYDRFGRDRKLEDRQALEYGIENGEGSISIELTDEQYKKLKTKRK